MIKSYRTAQVLAHQLLAQAIANEPNTTADLQTIAPEVSAEIVGLENKFKTEMSLIRKLINAANTNAPTLEEVVEIIKQAFLNYSHIVHGVVKF